MAMLVFGNLLVDGGQVIGHQAELMPQILGGKKLFHIAAARFGKDLFVFGDGLLKLPEFFDKRRLVLKSRFKAALDGFLADIWFGHVLGEEMADGIAVEINPRSRQSRLSRLKGFGTIDEHHIA